MGSFQIWKVNFGYKDNWIVYDDHDAMYDNSHMTSGITLKYVIEAIKESGADVIYTSTTNNNPDTPTLDRVKKICKACGYNYVDKSEWKESYRANGERWYNIKYELHKIKSPQARQSKPSVKPSTRKKSSHITRPSTPVKNTVNKLSSGKMKMIVKSYGVDDSKNKRL